MSCCGGVRVWIRGRPTCGKCGAPWGERAEWRQQDFEAFIEAGRWLSDIFEGWCEWCGIAMPNGPASQVCSASCARAATPRPIRPKRLFEGQPGPQLWLGPNGLEVRYP